MHNFLVVLQIIFSIVIIVSVLMQRSKTDGLKFISSGADTFYAKNKGKTSESMLKTVTVVSSVGFAIVTVLLNIVK